MVRDPACLALLGSCSVVALAVPAWAQDPAPPSPANTLAGPERAQPTTVETPSGNTASADTNTADIIVTGSRVIQNGNNSPTPVTVVTTAQLTQVTPSNIPDALNRLPVFSGSRNAGTFNNGSSNAVGNYLNLRNIGAQRTLILFDGHRVGPTTQDGLIDTNTIPQLLLQRVDVVTGGASAVYGSDAISGVVNFIVDKKFTGFKVQGQGGISQKSGNASQRAGLAWGTDLFGGRGHFEASYEYFDSAGVPTKLTRDLGRKVYAETGGGTTANPYHLNINTRLSGTSFLGVINTGAGVNTNNPFRDYVFGTNGVLRPFVHGAASGTTNIESGGDGGYYDQASLQASLRSHQGFGRFDYNLTDSISAYVQVSATESYNMTNYQSTEVRNYTLSSSNAFLAPQYQAAMRAAGVSTFTFSRIFQDAAPLVIDATVKNVFAVAGLTGKLGSKLSWDVSYSRTMGRQRVSTDNNVNNARMSAATDAVVNPATGNIVCNVTLTNPTLYPGCVPVNLFGPTSLTAAAVNYVLGRSTYHLKNDQDDVAASIAGSLFDTWAGPVRMALSGEYRHLTLDITSDAHPLDRVNCTGLRFNCNSTTPLFLSNVVADVHGVSQAVTEGAFEVDAPLLKDTIISSLNLNGAVRYTHYDTSGNKVTWKVGLDAHVNDQITLRATRSRDIRAPNLNDLFAPISVNPAGYTDLHTGNVSGVANVQSQGNANLVPEVANTLTGGIVLKPAFLARFTLAVDYYRIKIGNAIGAVSGQTAAVQQQCELSGGTDPLCALFIRPFPFSNATAANFPTTVLSQPLNIATLKTDGIDLEANYSAPLFGGNFSIRGLATYVSKLTTVTIPNAIPAYQAGSASTNTAGLPKVRATAFVHYDLGPASFDVQERWFSSTRPSSNHTLVYSDPRFPAAAYTDLTLSYLFKAGGGQAQLFVNVQNLLNKKPTPFANAGGGSSVAGLFVTTANGEDVIGRYFTGGVRFRF